MVMEVNGSHDYHVAMSLANERHCMNNAKMCNMLTA